MRFRTTILQSGKNTTGIVVPADVVEQLGACRKPAVRVTVGGHTYRSSIPVRGRRCTSNRIPWRGWSSRATSTSSTSPQAPTPPPAAPEVGAQNAAEKCGTSGKDHVVESVQLGKAALAKQAEKSHVLDRRHVAPISRRSDAQRRLC